MSLTSRAILMLILFIPIGFSLVAQPSNFRFKTIDKTVGLSSNYVNTIYQDSQGFLWVGTRDGLNRYDGYSFKIYTAVFGDSTSLPSAYINTIYEDRDHVLWIGTQSGGLSRYNREKDNFTNYTFHSRVEGLTKNHIRSIYRDEQKNIWLGIEAFGLLLFNERTQEVVKVGRSNMEVLDIFEDREGVVWIASADGLNYYDFDKKEIVSVTDNDPAYRLGFGTKHLSEDREGNIWVGLSKQGLLKYSKKNKNVTVYQPDEKNGLSKKEVQSILEDSKGNIWITSINDGLRLFYKEQATSFAFKHDARDVHSIGVNSIPRIFEDNVGNVWFGTHGAGLCYVNVRTNHFKHYFSTHDHDALSHNLVSSFYETPEGDIWVGTDGGGINLFNREKDTFKSYKIQDGLPSNAVLDFERESDSEVWIATWSGGMSLFNTKTLTIKNFNEEKHDSTKLSYPNLKSVKKDSEGRIWMAAHGADGLMLYDPVKNNFYKGRQNPTGIDLSIPIWGTEILQDSRGDMWFATNDGLHRLHNGEMITYYPNDSDRKSVISHFIPSIFEDSKGNVWIGTNKGVDVFDRKSNGFRHMSEEFPGLPKTVKAILEDDSGNIWISSSNGLTRFDPESGSIRNFDQSDGLQGTEFFEKSCLKSSTGELYFGGLNGFNVFHPDSLGQNTQIPPVYINELQIFNVAQHPSDPNSILQKSISETETITLDYTHSVFSLGFVALDFTAPQKNQYAYKLEGFDKKWNHVGNKRTATYTNLDPGVYNFVVKASNNDGIWNEEGRRLQIIIRPPFWRTWWFKVMSVSGVSFLAFAFYSARVSSINKQKAELEAQVHERTVELSMSSANLAKINKELDQFAYVVSHDLKAPLRAISNLSKWIAEDLEDVEKDDVKKNMSLLADRVARMQNLIDGILQYSKVGRIEMAYEPVKTKELIQEVVSVLSVPQKFEITIDDVMPILRFNKVWLEQIFTNLISNAIKYNDKEKGYISIGYTDVGRFHQFYVADNGPGIAAESQEKVFIIFQTLQSKDNSESTGVGLSIVKKIIEEQGGSIWIESDGKMGSKFIFTVPKEEKESS